MGEGGIPHLGRFYKQQNNPTPTDSSHAGTKDLTPNAYLPFRDPFALQTGGAGGRGEGLRNKQPLHLRAYPPRKRGGATPQPILRPPPIPQQTQHIPTGNSYADTQGEAAFRGPSASQTAQRGCSAFPPSSIAFQNVQLSQDHPARACKAPPRVSIAAGGETADCPPGGVADNPPPPVSDACPAPFPCPCPAAAAPVVTEFCFLWPIS